MLRTLPRTASNGRLCARRGAAQPVYGSLRTRYDLLHQQKRRFADLPAALVPPVIFGGLFVGLWTWKCCMMVLFQNKIIYMPGLPPNARWETIAAYKSRCGGIEWCEERIRSLDGTRISLCVASVNGAKEVPAARTVYILYFQGCFILSLLVT